MIEHKLEVGTKVYLSKTVAEFDVYCYASIIGDFNPIHVNSVVAKESTFKARIAHGMLGVGYIYGAITEHFDKLYVTKQKISFKKPIYFDDTITVRIEITDITESGDIHIISNIFNQNDKLVTEASLVCRHIKEIYL